MHTLVNAARAWSADRAGRLGAGIAYYSLFTLVPILLLAVSLAPLAGATEIYYFTGWDQPHAHYGNANGWTRPPGQPMQRLGGGWWKADTPTAGVVREIVFNNGSNIWDNAPPSHLTENQNTVV